MQKHCLGKPIASKMKFRESILSFLLLIACQGIYAQDDDLIKYRGDVRCRLISINDTMRLSCTFNTHPAYIEYLEEYSETVSDGQFKSVDNCTLLWNGIYYSYDPSEKKTVPMTFENGILKQD